ncbi:Carbon monoxide dehydrogenase [Bordetella tumbae]|uniref:SRPBCC family protein n=1 Tax=Bordetella tumbae TaxID=1649139 RepID=UPI0039EEB814
MQIEQSFDVAMPLATVWAAFHEPALLVQCLPGASLRGEPVGDELPLLFKVKLGPIAAAFSGLGSLSLDEAGHSGEMTGQATDGKSNSRVKGAARFAVVSQDSAVTSVNVTVDFSITGSLAQFSREGIVRALGDQLTKQFAQNLQAMLSTQSNTSPADDIRSTSSVYVIGSESGAVVIPADGPSASSERMPKNAASQSMGQAKTVQQPSEAPALNLFALVLAMMRDAWKKWIGRDKQAKRSTT